ncbi:N-acetyltransferase family protein [Paenibacillus thiaminolyticus]|nr:N-acetyltransferase family protein [Paenibacillus thiaminolyticus]
MIREATEQDLPAILEIYNDAIIHSTAVYSYEPQSLEQRTEWFRQKRRDNLPVLVYEAENRVMGFAAFGPFRAWPAYQYTIEHSVYVHNECRHFGIGSQLLREIIRIAADSGYKTLVAGIDESNLGSISLHEKLGFTYAGTIRNAGYKFNQWLNLCFYQYELPGPDQPVERGEMEEGMDSRKGTFHEY